MSKGSWLYSCPAVDTAGAYVVSQAGGLLLTKTARAVGLGQALSAQLSRWRRLPATHDLAKVVLDLEVTLALGGDCLSDIAVLHAEPASTAGWEASDPTVSRLIDRPTELASGTSAARATSVDCHTRPPESATQDRARPVKITCGPRTKETGRH